MRPITIARLICGVLATMLVIGAGILLAYDLHKPGAGRWAEASAIFIGIMLGWFAVAGPAMGMHLLIILRAATRACRCTARACLTATRFVIDRIVPLLDGWSEARQRRRIDRQNMRRLAAASMCEVCSFPLKKNRGLVFVGEQNYVVCAKCESEFASSSSRDNVRKIIQASKSQGRRGS